MFDRSKECFDKKHEELVNIRSETLHITDYTKVLTEINTKFSSKLIKQEKHISSLTTPFQENLKKMSVGNRVGRNIEAAESEIEATIETKAITPNKLTSSSEQPFTDIIKWPLLKSTETYSHASQFTKHFPSPNLEGDTPMIDLVKKGEGWAVMSGPE